MARKRDAQVTSDRERKPVNRTKGEVRPDYYKLKGGNQVIDIIAIILEIYSESHMDHPSELFCLGNAIKYEFRMGLKPNAFDDEKKRDTYLQMGKINPVFWRDIAMPVINGAKEKQGSGIDADSAKNKPLDGQMSFIEDKPVRKYNTEGIKYACE